MGNFYTNIVLRDDDVDAVAAELERTRRRAYVAGTSKFTLVFDEACDKQDLEELQRLAAKLSGQHGPAFAVCNHDDDVLWYALAVGGRVVDKYNSFPSYFDEGGDDPEGGDAARLCAAFGRSERRADLEALLRRRHSEIGLEVDRHLDLCRLLDLPSESVGLGYGYVSQGEFASETGVLKAVGGAPEPGGETRSPTRSHLAGTPAGILAEDIAALLRSDIEIPPGFSRVLGSGRVNAMLALERLKGYIAMNRMLRVGPPTMVNGDAFIEEVLGARDLHFNNLTRVFCERFRVPPLTEEEKTAMASGDAEFLRRQAEALTLVIEQRQRDVGRR